MDKMVVMEKEDLWVHQALQARMDCLDCLEDQVLREKQGAKEHKAQQEQRVILAHQELVVSQEEMDLLDPRDPQE